MQFSSNGLHGTAALEYIKAKQSGQIKTTIPSNVSPEADKVFMQEIKRTDPARYKKLIANMQKAAYAALRSSPASAIKYCENQVDGKHLLPDATRKNAKYCHAACKQAAYRSRAA